MTEDHKISSYSERLRMEAMGEPLRDGETRLCGTFKFLYLVITFRRQDLVASLKEGTYRVIGHCFQV